VAVVAKVADGIVNRSFLVYDISATARSIEWAVEQVITAVASLQAGRGLRVEALAESVS
jgi:hypothetical protein